MVSLASCQEKQGFGLRCGELEKQVCSGQGCGHGHLQVVFPKEGGWRERERAVVKARLLAGGG